MASGRLRFLNWICRFLVRPKIRRSTNPVKSRRDLARTARFVFRSPAFLCALSEPLLHWISVGRCDPRKLIFYIHGGAYLVGSPEIYQGLLGRLSKLSGLRVAALRYRLGPEHPCPAALEDARAGYARLLAKGYLPEDIAIGGDSAGGGVALALLAELTQAGTAPAAVFLFSPWTDLTLSGASLRTNAESDRLLPVDRILDAAEMARGYCSAGDPRISPLFASYRDPPPVLFQVAATEVLLDDTTRMAARLERFGGVTRVSLLQDAPHVWQIFDGYVPEARAALCEVAGFLAEIFSSAPESARR